MTLLDLDISPPPSYKRFIELEDWYYAHRGIVPTNDIEQNLRERQTALYMCLNEVALSKGAYILPIRLVQTLAGEMEDLIRGLKADLLIPFKRGRGRPKQYPHIKMAIEQAVNYIALNKIKHADFNRKSYIKDIYTAFDVDEQTVHDWLSHDEYKEIQKNPILWPNLKFGMGIINFMADIFRYSGKAYSVNALANKGKRKK
jgi:hypothetical protein